MREAFAQHIARDRGVHVTPENVVVTPGAKPIIFFTLLACVDEGDEVIYPNPGFPIYESVVNFVGAKPVPLPLREEKDFSFDVDELRSLVTDKTKFIILNSPQNPTGGVLSRKDLEGIADIVREQEHLGAERRGLQQDHLRRRGALARARFRAWRSGRSSSTDTRRPTR